VPIDPQVILSAAVVVAVVAVGYRTWVRRRREREERYDLRRLYDPREPEVEEPFEDTVPEGNVGAPYCGWCDEAYPPGTYRCRQCGREL
jgi:hypothetical protein